ncbi:MAG TPA: Nramp family divalent metal transporter [Chitinophagaceae bacterium]|jgi:NRAMP (natural resistance-associated macrophage protein)-like metal ion transporter|nr:Nramp family divalent metal transporter [Chitinophagaceae bacterium]
MNAPGRFVYRLKNFWLKLGPGLITGASDDDPSGIATYSQAGARFGPKLLWSAVVTLPLMVAMQAMCARIGLVTNSGLMATIKKYYPRYVMYLILLVSFPTITINIGADIAGMGAVAHLLAPRVPASVFSILFTVLLIYTIVMWSYRRIATVLKWLCITLFTYLLIPFFTSTHWRAALRDTFLPALEWNRDYLLALVGILGTTISPYLFFWQASMEVEEQLEKKLIVDKKSVEDMETDVRGGMFFSNLVFYFIVLTTGTVLYGAGVHGINTVQDAAEALRPLAGEMAYALFAVGVLGTGFLAIPVLGGSLSYMLAEAFNWQEGMNKKFYEARGFYITLIVSLSIGLLILFTPITAVQALIYSAVLYGLVAPVIIGIILHICNNKKIMGEYTNTVWANIWGILTLVVMSAAAIALLYFLFF